MNAFEHKIFSRNSRPLVRRKIRLSLCLSIFLGLVGSAYIAQAKTPPPVKKGAPSKPKTSPVAGPKKPAASSAEFDLSKADSDPHGPGVVVGEPVVLSLRDANLANDRAELAAFGAACSRWLQLNVGGQGELEQTPLWSQIEASRREMKRANWCLTSGDVPAARRMLGVTHVVLGTIATTTNPNSYELKYQVVNADNSKAAKPPVVLTLKGTKAEILSQLPAQATQLSRVLGVRSPQAPASVGIDAQAMTLLGKGGWVYAEKVTPDEVKQIGNYAALEPLAALLALEYNDREGVKADWEYDMIKGMGVGQSFMDSELKRTLVDEVMTKLPTNSLAHAEICLIDPHQIAPHYEQQKLLNQKYKYNYALGAATLLVELSKGNPAATEQISPFVIYAGYRNPYTWLLMGKCLGVQASARRAGRIASLISQEEWKTLSSYYKNWQIVTRRAASFDPQNIEAWKALAVAATFNGDEVTADGAFWKAYKLDPDDLENLQWGLQMYQPKWGGDPGKLAKIIAASKTPAHIVYLGDDVASTLNAIDETESAEAVKRQTIKEVENQVRLHQREFLPALRLAVQTQDSNYYHHLVSLRPKSSAAHWLWAMRESAFAPKEQIVSYETAIRLDPRNPLLRRELAVAYVNAGQFQRGADQLELFVKEDPRNVRPYKILGLAYYLLDQTDKSLAAYLKVVELDPETRDPDIFIHLCDLRTRQGQFDRALNSGRFAIELYPDIATLEESAKDPRSIIKYQASWAYAFYGWALLKNGQTKEALQRSQQAIQLDPLNAAAHGCLGDIYLAQNQMDKARAEWELAVKYAQVNNGGVRRSAYFGDLARAQLTKYLVSAPQHDTAPATP